MTGNQITSDVAGYSAMFQVFLCLFFGMRLLTLGLGRLRRWARVAFGAALVAAAAGVAALALQKAGWPTAMCEFAIVVVLGAVLGLAMHGWQGVRCEYVTSASVVALAGIWAAGFLEARWGTIASGRGAAFGVRLAFSFFLFAMARLVVTVVVAGFRWVWAGIAAPLKSVGRAAVLPAEEPKQPAARKGEGSKGRKPEAAPAETPAAAVDAGECPQCTGGRLHELSGPVKGSKFLRCGHCGYEEVVSAAA